MRVPSNIVFIPITRTDVHGTHRVWVSWEDSVRHAEERGGRIPTKIELQNHLAEYGGLDEKFQFVAVTGPSTDPNGNVSDRDWILIGTGDAYTTTGSSQVELYGYPGWGDSSNTQANHWYIACIGCETTTEDNTNRVNRLKSEAKWILDAVQGALTRVDATLSGSTPSQGVANKIALLNQNVTKIQTDDDRIRDLLETPTEEDLAEAREIIRSNETVRLQTEQTADQIVAQIVSERTTQPADDAQSPTPKPSQAAQASSSLIAQNTSVVLIITFLIIIALFTYQFMIKK